MPVVQKIQNYKIMTTDTGVYFETQCFRAFWWNKPTNCLVSVHTHTRTQPLITSFKKNKLFLRLFKRTCLNIILFVLRSDDLHIYFKMTTKIFLLYTDLIRSTFWLAVLQFTICFHLFWEWLQTAVKALQFITAVPSQFIYGWSIWR